MIQCNSILLRHNSVKIVVDLGDVMLPGSNRVVEIVGGLVCSIGPQPCES